MDNYKNGLLSDSMVYCTALYMAAQNGNRDVVKYISELPIKPTGSHFFKNTVFYLAVQNGHVHVLEYFARNGINFWDDLDESTEDLDCADEKASGSTLFKNNVDTVHAGQVHIEENVNMLEVNSADNGTAVEQEVESNAIGEVKTFENGNHNCASNSETANNIIDEDMGTNFVNTNANIDKGWLNNRILYSHKINKEVCQKMPETKLDNTGCNNLTHDNFKVVTEETSAVKMNKATTDASDQIASTSNNKISLHSNETGQNKTIEDNENFITDDVIIEEKCENVFHAVKSESLEQVRMFLDKCADVDAVDESNDTLVHIAAARGNVDVLKILLDKGAKLKPKNIYGNAPIHVACELGNVHVVEEFLEQGVNIGIMNPLGNTLTHLAAQHNHLELLKLLLDKGANTKQTNKNGETLLHLAVKNGSQSVVELFLDPTYKDIIDLNEEIKSNGNTLLIVAIEMQHQSIFSLLLAAKVDVNIKNKDGETALHTATRIGLDSFIHPLLRSNVDVNIQNCKGETALHIAIQTSLPAVIQSLLQANIDVNIQDNEGQTAAFYTSDVTIMELLNESGLDLKLTNKDGETILHNAAKCNYLNIIDYLLMKQVFDVNLCAEENETALYIAASHGHGDVIELLLKYNAKLNINSERRHLLQVDNFYIHSRFFNALHIAVFNGHYNVVEILLEHGMDANEFICDGKDTFFSPIMISEIKDHAKIAKLLLLYGAKKQLKVNISSYTGKIKQLLSDYQPMS